LRSIRGKQRNIQGRATEDVTEVKIKELSVDVTETVVAIGESTIEVTVGWTELVESMPKRSLRKFCRLTLWRRLWSKGACIMIFGKKEGEKKGTWGYERGCRERWRAWGGTMNKKLISWHCIQAG
jgi:hypothetical protein